MPPRTERRKHDKLVITCVALTIVCTVVTVLFVAPTVVDTHHLGQENNHRIRDVAALTRDNARLANEAKRLASEIQRSRVRNIRDNCQQQNEKNRNTIAAIDKLTAPRLADAPPQERRQIKQGTAGFVFVITQLAPVRDCKALVRKQAHTQ